MPPPPRRSGPGPLQRVRACVQPAQQHARPAGHLEPLHASPPAHRISGAASAYFDGCWLPPSSNSELSLAAPRRRCEPTGMPTTRHRAVRVIPIAARRRPSFTAANMIGRLRPHLALRDWRECHGRPTAGRLSAIPCRLGTAWRQHAAAAQSQQRLSWPSPSSREHMIPAVPPWWQSISPAERSFRTDFSAAARSPSTQASDRTVTGSKWPHTPRREQLARPAPSQMLRRLGFDPLPRIRVELRLARASGCRR